MAKLLARLSLLLALMSLALFAADPNPAFAVAQPTTRTLFLIRHGMFDSKPGANDKTANALTPVGQAQAGYVADRLASLPLKFDSIASSEFTRARETGDIIAAKLGLPITRDGLLNECGPSRTGRTVTPAEAVSDAQLAHAWARYTAPVNGAPAHQVLVCHGNVIRWFVCRALGVNTQQWARMEIANCSITVIQIHPDGDIRLLMFNDISHVPTEKQTWAGEGPGWPLPAQTKMK
ncbi:MAG: histidine phosphatase family protein [Opitutaceae bacterium]